MFRAIQLHHRTNCTGLQTRTVIKGFGDLHATIAPNRMCVGIKRIELLTFRVSGECSNQLSYIPMLYRWLDLNQRALRPKRSEIDRTPLHLYFVIGPGLEPKLIESKSIVLTNYTIRQFEQVFGFEPKSPVWKTRALTVVLYLQLVDEQHLLLLWLPTKAHNFISNISMNQ